MARMPSPPGADAAVVRAIVPTSAIVPDADNRRIAEDDDFEALCDSIRLLGILQAVQVWRRPDGTHRLIDGERRWRAAQKVGLGEIPCDIWPGQADLRRVAIAGLALNELRKAHGCLQVARRLRHIKNESGLSHAELAEQTGLPLDRVKTYFSLFGGSDEMLTFRFCEVAALRWGDIDLSTGALRIRRAIYRGEVGEPKTHAGRRLVVLPPEVRAILRELGPGEADAWIFPSAEGTPLSTGILNKPISRALERIGIKRRLTTHGLRRTFKSLALQVAPAETVRKVIGHADAAMTLHYLHVDTEQRRQLGEGVFGKIREVEGKWKPEVVEVLTGTQAAEKPSMPN